MEIDGRTWHALTQSLWGLALVFCTGCGQADDGDSNDSGGPLGDARAAGSTGSRDPVTTGGADAAGADDAGSALDGGTDHDADDRTLWNDDSVAIDFTLRGPVGQLVCEFSATRDELTAAQLEGLSSLQLHGAQLRAGCDLDNYTITVHAKDSSSKKVLATLPDCASKPIVLFSDFDTWAQSTPCSSKSH